LKQVVKPETLAEAWGAEALYTKAIRYAEKMNACATDSWDHALWSGLCLELLARAALANIAPALLADPGNPNNLLNALGFSPMEAKFSPKSVGAAVVLKRLRHLLPEFDTELEGFCVTHVGRRNAELHSGELPYDGVHGSRWHGQYFRSCKALLASMGYDLKEMIGDEAADIAEKEIAAAADQTAKAVLGDVTAFAQRWAELGDDERAARSARAKVWAVRSSGHRVECPACKNPALVNGEPIGAAQQTLEDDVITERQEHLPHWLECVACGLKITGLSRLQVVNLGDRYASTQTYEAAEYYRSDDDQYADYEEDNNEPA
jgi:hypothetical protein